ncbi:uncharacterized protein LOC128743939 [Sabethes cyaneus]|uniref:uncharacterized protein LOC128743939 n=1 Tax=Sabethes cyaneus TaxID=53552 RepID=UPI00237E304A|nr:uncharacterized protein LOC128743939 [Sabethes cyaneus]
MALLFLLLIFSKEFSNVASEDYSSDNRTLSRGKRFLLFPVNAQLLFTVSGGKALLFKGPGGYNVITELDMYHPLPDYRNRLTSLRLGEVSLLPTGTTTTTTAEPTAYSMDETPSAMEVEQYLKDHPDEWTPPDAVGYSSDRSDWFLPWTGEIYNPHAEGEYPASMDHLVGHFDRYFPRKKRFAEQDNDDDGEGYEHEMDRFNLSQHRHWEHFYHYRDRRELFHALEQQAGDRTICEVRRLNFPPSRSMIMDLVQIVFRIPLREELHDEYSAAMRQESLDCHRLYGEKCPISIFNLILFGKFVP